ncbi:hypothetical protein A2U01_0017276 [Trifolium medium]|uniref:Gag-pol polyprotein n=1 Tax=Trifolium medium TaxID=97028 RepID=A0A392N9F8_9FABA|nr:hypothetical protein [Trifolium medium]
MEVSLPVGMEKPPAMDTYDGSADPDDHIENIEPVGIKEIKTLDAFLEKAQKYIAYEEKAPAKANVGRGKYCRYHRSYGHVTEDCVHLKDAIEILIQKGYARKYVKDGDKETHEAQMAIEAPTLEEDDNGHLCQLLSPYRGQRISSLLLMQTRKGL